MGYICRSSTPQETHHACCTMKTAFFASALLAMAAGLEIDWIVSGEATSACVAPGEIVNFNWEGPWHNVVDLGDDEISYAECILTEDQTEAGEGPWSTTLSDEGIYFFVCGVKTHCSAGNQKAEIVVSTNC